MEHVIERQEIYAIKARVRYREVNMKFGRTKTPTISQAMEIADRYTIGDKEDQLRSGKSRASDAHQSENKGKKHKWKADAKGNAEAVALASQGKKNP